VSAARIAVRVTPRAGRDQILGWENGELSVRVTAAPDGGGANAAVCALVARALGVPKSAVRVARGHASRHKLLEADGVDGARVDAALGKPAD
jgi:uncharacterized protein YggU (UPF0235/DUF167 family)